MSKIEVAIDEAQKANTAGRRSVLERAADRAGALYGDTAERHDRETSHPGSPVRNTVNADEYVRPHYPQDARKTGIRQATGGTLLVRPDTGVPVSKLVAAQGLYYPASEEYRKLKEHLVRVTQRDGFQNVILITSSTVGEGKSLTSVNLAVSLAQEFDHTVLLIDADMRRPTCHTYLGGDVSPGLAECLMDGVDMRDALVPTGIGKLSFLPAGRPVDNPVEVLGSARMRDFIREIKHRYPDRYVIIDTAPVLPFAEARFLSQYVDGTLLVVRERTVAKSDVQDSLQALEGATIFGIVYNGASRQPASSGYYSYGYADRI